MKTTRRGVGTFTGLAAAASLATCSTSIEGTPLPVAPIGGCETNVPTTRYYAGGFTEFRYDFETLTGKRGEPTKQSTWDAIQNEVDENTLRQTPAHSVRITLSPSVNFENTLTQEQGRDREVQPGAIATQQLSDSPNFEYDIDYPGLVLSGTGAYQGVTGTVRILDRAPGDETYQFNFIRL